MDVRAFCSCAAAIAALAVLAAGCGGSAQTAAARHATLAAPAAAPGSGPTPYTASLAYARCMRAHGVVHPNPDKSGDFQLTPAQERRMRASATPKEHEAADKACFRFLKGTFSTKPLSAAARRAALVPLRELKRCLEGHGYHVGEPTVTNMSRGRAMFGFDRAGTPPATARARARLQAVQHTCERKVHLAARIDAIVKFDRGESQ